MKLVYVVILAVLFGCYSVDDPATCGMGGGGVGGDGGRGGASAECRAADDCPGPHWRCERRTCVNGVCGHAYAPAGTPDLVDSFPGDCSLLVCDGAGRSMRVFAASDIGDDGNECTIEACTSVGHVRHDADDGTECVTRIDGHSAIGACLGGNCIAE
jgi:hypothetical protein